MAAIDLHPAKKAAAEVVSEEDPDVPVPGGDEVALPDKLPDLPTD